MKIPTPPAIFAARFVSELPNPSALDNGSTLEYAKPAQKQTGLVFCEKHQRHYHANAECGVCFAEKRNAESLARQRAEFEEQQRINQENLILDNTVYAQLPRCYVGKSWADYRCDHQEQAQALDTAKRFVSKFTHDILPNGKNLILTGTTGTGKTLLACIIAQALLSEGVRVKYIKASAILREIRESYSGGERRASQIIREYCTVPLLILDEVGVQYGTSGEVKDLFEIIDGRYENLLPTIVLSNIPVQELNTFLGERSISRLKERGIHLRCQWADYRIATPVGVH